MKMAMKVDMKRGSHLPVLIKLVQMTSGSILELGCGPFSTFFLHWVCYPAKRRLVTYENNSRWFDFANLGKSDFHEVHCVDNLDAIDLSEPWSIAFVDHEPGTRRPVEMARLLHADYVVAHDTENRSARKYGYPAVYRLFKYRFKYTDAYPHTSVFSNKHDLSRFTVI